LSGADDTIKHRFSISPRSPGVPLIHRLLAFTKVTFLWIEVKKLAIPGDPLVQFFLDLAKVAYFAGLKVSLLVSHGQPTRRNIAFSTSSKSLFVPSNGQKMISQG
jgi:hypothetical protein